MSIETGAQKGVTLEGQDPGWLRGASERSERDTRSRGEGDQERQHRRKRGGGVQIFSACDSTDDRTPRSWHLSLPAGVCTNSDSRPLAGTRLHVLTYLQARPGNVFPPCQSLGMFNIPPAR